MTASKIVSWINIGFSLLVIVVIVGAVVSVGSAGSSESQRRGVRPYSAL